MLRINSALADVRDVTNEVGLTLQLSGELE